MKESKREKNRAKKIYFLLLSVFIIGLSIYLYQRMFPTDAIKKTEDTKETMIIHDQIKHENNDSKSDGAKETSKDDVEEIKDVIKEFISAFYTYDENKRGEHLEASKPYLKDDFYKELVLTDDENTKVPFFSYRNVKDISFLDYTKNEDTYRFVVDTTSELLDDKKTRISTVGIEFNIDVAKVKNDWKVSYFTLVGKSIVDDETTD